MEKRSFVFFSSCGGTRPGRNHPIALSSQRSTIRVASPAQGIAATLHSGVQAPLSAAYERFASGGEAVACFLSLPVSGHQSERRAGAGKGPPAYPPHTG